jgi:Lon protease-like protein
VRLPLFPLPLVLLPGMRLPLHIFEPRYRVMLRDCLETDRTFGLIYREESTPERDIAAGTVGCKAVIDDVEPLGDGRSNIIVNGTERFALVRFTDADSPYLVAQVVPFEDEEEPVAQVTALALRLGELFVEAATASRALDDDGAPVPILSEDPGRIAFAAAASVDLDPADRQRLLASSSPSARMREMITILDSAIPALRERAGIHREAKQNGKGNRRHS